MTSEQRIFRLVQSNDLPAVSAIFKQASLVVPIPNCAAVGARSQMASTYLHVCESRSEIVGAIHSRCLGTEAEILDIAVDARHPRRGIGSFLIANFIQQAVLQNVGEIFLEVRESNAAALALYRKFDFSISGRRPNYYRDPEEAALLLNLKILG